MSLGYVGNMSVSTYFGVLGTWGPCQCLHARAHGSWVCGGHVGVYLLWTFVHMGLGQASAYRHSSPFHKQGH